MTPFNLQALITLKIALLLVSNNCFSAESDTKWLMKDMWKTEYTATSPRNITREEKAFLESTKPGSGKNLKLLNYISDNRCVEPTIRCYVLQSAASNAMIDIGKLEIGVKSAVNAYKPAKQAGVCPIIYESTLLRYKLAIIDSNTTSERSAKDLISRIKNHGGLTQDMRTETCNKLAQKKPLLFRNYVALVSKLLTKGDAEMQKLGIEISQKLKEESNE